MERTRPVRFSRTHAVAYSGLALFVFILFRPLFAGRALYWGDLLLYFEPMANYAGQVLRQGRIPLWNPLVLCGQPFLGNPQMAVFYPASALLPIVGPQIYVSIITVVHVFLCGFFAFRFFRSLGFRSVSAFCGSLVYMGGGCLIGRAQFPPMLATAAYFPFLLQSIDAAIRRPAVGGAVTLAMAVGLMVLAAHPQLAYLCLCCGGFYGGFRLLSLTRSRSVEKLFARRALIVLASGLCVGLLVAAAQALPALQLLLVSPREELTALQANRFYLDPERLLSLIVPRFFGHPGSADFWSGGNAWEPELFVGWAPLALAAYALIRCRERRLVQFWGTGAVLAVWLALGNLGGLYWLAFHVVPGLSMFHDPARFLFVMTFAVAVLTVVGLDEAVKGPLRGSVAQAAVVICVTAPLLWYGQDWNPATPTAAVPLRPVAPAVMLLRSMVGDRWARTYLPAHDLFWQRFIRDGYADYGSDSPRTLRAFQRTFLPNLNMFDDIPSASGYEPVPVSGPSAINGLAADAARRGEPNFGRLTALADAATIVAPGPARLYDPRIPTASTAEGLWVGRNRDRIASCWLVRSVIVVQGTLRTAATLAAPDFDPLTKAVISEAPLTPDRTAASTVVFPPAATASGQCVCKTRTATTLSVDVDTGKSAGFVVFSLAAYPGWKGRVDGRTCHLYRANGAFMGVFVGPGRHRVSASYRPDVVRVGLFFSLIACAALAAGVVFAIAWQEQPDHFAPGRVDVAAESAA